MLDTNATTAHHVAAIARDGYTIVPDAIDLVLVDELTADLEQLESVYEIEPSPNVFEGALTKRVYNLLALSPVWQHVPVHERVLPIVEGVLDHGCLVSSLSSIRIMPEETAQPIHADDQLMPLSKPHVPTVCNTMWALTDFTDANGATSHPKVWAGGDCRVGGRDLTVEAVRGGADAKCQQPGPVGSQLAGRGGGDVSGAGDLGQDPRQRLGPDNFGTVECIGDGLV